MKNKENKSALFTSSLGVTQNSRKEKIFTLQHQYINAGEKYLGFILKPNNCGKGEWGCL